MLGTESNYVEKISHFLFWFALRYLMGPLNPGDYHLSLQILVSYNLDVMVTKNIAYNKKLIHLHVVFCKYQCLGALSPSKLWNHPRVVSWARWSHYFGACEVNRWVKPYLQMGWFFLSLAFRLHLFLPRYLFEFGGIWK